MTRARILCVCLTAAAMATPAAADVTVKRKNDIKVVGRVMSGSSVQFIKGTKLREDQTIGGVQTSTIMDAATRQMISLNHQKREAEVWDMKAVGAALEKMPVSDVEASLTPTTQTRQVAGFTCTMHDMRASALMDVGGEKLKMVISGPVCLAKDAPGSSEIAAFFKAAGENGLLFGDPRSAKAQPGQLKAMTAMYLEMARLGVPLAQEMNVELEGSGPMAAMMSKMGGSTMNFEVESLSSDTISDATFEVPADYKVVKR